MTQHEEQVLRWATVRQTGQGGRSYAGYTLGVRHRCGWWRRLLRRLRLVEG